MPAVVVRPFCAVAELLARVEHKHAVVRNGTFVIIDIVQAPVSRAAVVPIGKHLVHTRLVIPRIRRQHALVVNLERACVEVLVVRKPPLVDFHLGYDRGRAASLPPAGARNDRALRRGKILGKRKRRHALARQIRVV